MMDDPVSQSYDIKPWQRSKYAKKLEDSFGQKPTLTPTFDNPKVYYPDKTTYVNMKALDPRPGRSTRYMSVGDSSESKYDDVYLRKKIYMSDPIPFTDSNVSLDFEDGGKTPKGETTFPHERARKGYKTLDKYKLHGGYTESNKGPGKAHIGADHAHNEEYGDGTALVYHTRELQTNRPGAHNFINLPGEEAIRQLGPTHYGEGINEANAFDEDQGPVVREPNYNWNNFNYYPSFKPNWWDVPRKKHGI